MKSMILNFYVRIHLSILNFQVNIYLNLQYFIGIYIVGNFSSLSIEFYTLTIRY